MLARSLSPPPIAIADINGDGVADFAQVLRGGNPYVSRVQLVDGASGAIIRTITSPPQLKGFGLGVYGLTTGVGASAPDVAIMSVNAADEATISLYSPASGLANATITVAPGGVAGTVSLLAMGDVDEDTFVTVDDLAAAVGFWAAGTTGPSIVQADFDGDGVVSENDVWEVALRLGMSTEDILSVDFVSGIPDTFGMAGPADGTETNDGVFGCLWCFIWCAKDLNKAVDCVANLPCPWDTCLAQYPNVNSDEFVDCFRTAKANGIKKCLKDIADAAGSCGKCVYKCGPQPS